MENSFVLSYISSEISLMQFHNGKNVHTEKVASPWARPRAFYPRVKWLASVMTLNVHGVLFRHRRSENSPFNTQNSPAKVHYTMNIFYSD